MSSGLRANGIVSRTGEIEFLRQTLKMRKGYSGSEGSLHVKDDLHVLGDLTATRIILSNPTLPKFVRVDMTLVASTAQSVPFPCPNGFISKFRIVNHSAAGGAGIGLFYLGELATGALAPEHQSTAVATMAAAIVAGSITESTDLSYTDASDLYLGPVGPSSKRCLYYDGGNNGNFTISVLVEVVAKEPA